MNAALAIGACLCFFGGFPAPALVLRCGLSACMRFSPRAALELSGLASLIACALLLLMRVLRRERFAFPPPLAALAFSGGALGRAAMLMLDASLPSSLALLRVQAPALALLMLAVTLACPRQADASPRAAALIALVLAALDGFLGSDVTLMLTALIRAAVARRRVPSASLLACLCAQLGASLLTRLCGVALVFPARMLAFVAAGAAAGAMLLRACKKRGALPPALWLIVHVYGLLAALACVGHAFFPR